MTSTPHISGSVTIRPIDRSSKADATRLIGLFNTLDEGWPGGWKRGIQPHLEGMMWKFEGWACNLALVAEADDRFLGICELKAPEADGDTGYVAFLYADPAIHGLGIGKRLLRTAIDYCIEQGYREVTLHTWAGNEKAMPLYKRMGFMWEPESDVYMRCFVPGIVNSTPGKWFFSKPGRDWYACLKNVPELVPDKANLNGMPVYQYLFQDGDDQLSVSVDCASGGITAIDCAQLEASCVLTGLTGPAGIVAAGDNLDAAWKVTWKKNPNTPVTITAQGDEWLEAQLNASTVAGVPTESMGIVSANFGAQPIKDGRRHGRLTTRIEGIDLDGAVETVVLETGARFVRPFEATLSESAFYPGVPQAVQLSIKNSVDCSRSITVSIIVPEGTEFNLESSTLNLLPCAVAEMKAEVTIANGGAYQAIVQIDSGNHIEHVPLMLRCHAGSPLVFVDSGADTLVQESAGYSVCQNLLGGRLHFSNKATGLQMELTIPDVGPPYNPWRWRKWPYLPLQLPHLPAGAAAISGHTVEQPDITVTRAVTPLSDSLLRIEITLQNTAAEAFDGAIRVNTGRSHPLALALPLESGVLHELTSDLDGFPVCTADFLAEGKSLSEGWVAMEMKGGVAGLLWRGEGVYENEWVPSLTLQTGPVPAHGSVTLEPMYVYLGPGNFSTVRNLWQRLTRKAGTAEPEELKKIAGRELTFSVNPVLLPTDEAVTVSLSAANRLGAPLLGEIHISAGGATVSPESIELPNIGIVQNETITRELSICAANGATADLTAELRLPRYDITIESPVISVGSKIPVAVAEEGEAGIYTVDNGNIRFQVSPRFAGSMFSLQHGSFEYLTSSYPQSRPMVWSNPWFGGVHPYLEWIGGFLLTKEAFAARVVTDRVGTRGLQWSGVETSCTLQHRLRRGLQVKTEYLTRADTSMAVVMVTWHNPTTGPISLPNAGVACWTNPGEVIAGKSATTTWWNNGQKRVRRLSQFSHEHNVYGCGLTESTDGHRMLLIASGGETGGAMKTEDFGVHGANFGTGGEITIKPGESERSLLWLVLEPADEDIDRLRSLKALTDLP